MIGFREAAAADLPAIVALLADDGLGGGREEAGPPLPASYLLGFTAMMAQGGRILLAVEGNAIVGCLQLNILHGVSQMGLSRAQVEGVRVAGTRRGQGVGGLLLREAIRLAREGGARSMQLTTNLARTEAQRFYEQLGFTRSHAGYKLSL